ncbi:MAG TPA: PLP-dependent aspartate aminotransferase family protein [Acidimicrobiia bacterium]|nr:PLP-dependent aspartate aminotransferase family protein [Acidimicrobiia bacterium]
MDERDPATTALHADRDVAELPDVAPPLRPSTTFDRAGGSAVYRRGDPEVARRLESVLGALEGGHAVAYPSGMAAIASVLRWIRPVRIALPDDVYHGTRDFVEAEAARGAWALARPEGLEAGDVWWVETPSNPKCLITDVAVAVDTAHARGVIVVVDSTFATPVLQHPLALGADVVVHATTKAIAGHSDALGGVVVTPGPDAAGELMAARVRDGMIPGVLETWLTLRGLRTLPLRVERQSDSALRIASWLLDHPRVERVWYPGLEDHPGHDVALRQMRGFGGVLSFELGSAEASAAAVRRFGVFRRATSLGGVESLAEHRLDADANAPPGLIRLSVGLEGVDDLLDDLDRGLGQD